MDNVNGKLKNIMSSGNFKGNIEPIMKLLTSAEGQKLMRSLSPKEKQAIIDRFMSLDKTAVENSLKNFKASDLSGMTAQDILNKLR